MCDWIHCRKLRQCAAGYIGYPACTECTDDVHCSSHSSAVAHNVNKTECSCTCNARFTCDVTSVLLGLRGTRTARSAL